jgi:hypothetical protein
MADDPKETRPQDAQRVNVNQDHELRYWTAKFGVSAEQLKQIVNCAGPMADDIRRAIVESKTTLLPGAGADARQPDDPHFHLLNPRLLLNPCGLAVALGQSGGPHRCLDRLPPRCAWAKFLSRESDEPHYEVIKSARRPSLSLCFLTRSDSIAERGGMVAVIGQRG